MATTVPTPPKHARGLPHEVLGMLLFVITELMLFTGLVSAYLISAAAYPGAWPPLNQPRLPVAVTGVNTLALLASGVLAWQAGRALARNDAKTGWLGWTFVLGAYFVGAQGMEWLALIRDGLTLVSSVHGYYFLIVGAHALHAIGALTTLFWALRRQVKGQLTTGNWSAIQIFWLFVVGVWPVLYVLVYLT